MVVATKPLPAVTAAIEALNTAPLVVKVPVVTVPMKTLPEVTPLAVTARELPVVVTLSVREVGMVKPPPPPEVLKFTVEPRLEKMSCPELLIYKPYESLARGFEAHGVFSALK